MSRMATALVFGLFLATAVTLSGCAASADPAGATPTATTTATATTSPVTYLTKLDLAVRVCDLPYSVAKYAVISDDGHTLTMDGSIASGYDEGLSDADEACIFNKLEMPDRVRQEINGTRPADGRVRASWGEFDASWTFSVTKGLNLIISDGKL